MRQKISASKINNILEQDDCTRYGILPRNFMNYRPSLYSSLMMPSYVNGYSICIEYMKKWFLSQFGIDKKTGESLFFRTVYINGKNVLDDWKHFNNYNIKREKPMLAIVPTVDYDYDRENLDMYMADKNLLLKRSNFQQSFFRDTDKHMFLYMQLRSLRMNFNFRIRLNSRSEQLDLFSKMEIWFRIGATQKKWISADFHVPYEVMADIAKDADFEIDKDGNIIDILDFINYLNAHSDIPFIFKIRAINQKPEFFIRVRELYVHIDTKEKLQLNDGEREGKLDTNFEIEMPCIVDIPVPQFYAYFNQVPITDRIKVVNNSTIGIYTINTFEIPETNKVGWNKMFVTEYMADEGETEIDLSPFISGNKGNVSIVYNDCIKNGINPGTFLDIHAYRRSGDISFDSSVTLDAIHQKLQLEIPALKDENIAIAAYYDHSYVNEYMINMQNYNNSRVSEDTNA